MLLKLRERMSSEKGFHPDRAAGRHAHHWDPGRDCDSDVFQSAEQGQRFELQGDGSHRADRGGDHRH